MCNFRTVLKFQEFQDDCDPCCHIITTASRSHSRVSSVNLMSSTDSDARNAWFMLYHKSVHCRCISLQMLHADTINPAAVAAVAADRWRLHCDTVYSNWLPIITVLHTPLTVRQRTVAMLQGCSSRHAGNTVCGHQFHGWLGLYSTTDRPATPPLLPVPQTQQTIVTASTVRPEWSELLQILNEKTCST